MNRFGMVAICCALLWFWSGKGVAQDQTLSADVDFETAWKLLQSPQSRFEEPAFRSFVYAQLKAEPWMLRARALAWMRPQDSHRVLEALNDPYPRVRMQAAQQLADVKTATVALAKVARRDDWPMVRAAAIRSLAEHPSSLPILNAAVDDPSRVVRRAAIEVLSKRADASNWPSVSARLLDAAEWEGVRRAALHYAVHKCLSRSQAVFEALVGRGAGADATDDDRRWAAYAQQAISALKACDAR